MNEALTASPVQNIGHLFQGASLASSSHVLRYGLRTINGNTGGVSFEADAEKLQSAEPTAAAAKKQCMVGRAVSAWTAILAKRIQTKKI